MGQNVIMKTDVGIKITKVEEEAPRGSAMPKSEWHESDSVFEVMESRY